MDFIRSKFTLFLHCEQNENSASSYSETYNIIQKIDLFVLLKSKSAVQIHIPRNAPYHLIYFHNCKISLPWEPTKHVHVHEEKRGWGYTVSKRVWWNRLMDVISMQEDIPCCICQIM